MKVSGRVFSYLGPRRKHFMVSTYDNEDKWTGFPIQQDDDLEEIKRRLKENYEKRK